MQKKAAAVGGVVVRDWAGLRVFTDMGIGEKGRASVEGDIGALQAQMS